jgi:hypothetical protein
MSGPYGAQTTRPGTEQVPEEPLDPQTQNQINAWLSADPLDKRSLLTAVHDADLAELDALRQTAMQEKIAQPASVLKTIVSAFTQPAAAPSQAPAQDQAPADVGAKKTTAAIEGLMLARQGRLDRIMAKMAADDERAQRMAERYGTTQTQMPTRGRRGRGRMGPQPDQQPVPRRGRR